MYFTVLENEGAYNLIHKGIVEFDKYKRDEVYFASLLIQKNFVGFYFMPQYTTENGPEFYSAKNLISLLKGKSCYNITESAFTAEVEADLDAALRKGLTAYKEKGWIKKGQ